MTTNKPIKFAHLAVGLLKAPPGLTVGQARVLTGKEKGLLVLDGDKIIGVMENSILWNSTLCAEDFLDNILERNFSLAPEELLEAEVLSTLPEILRAPTVIYDQFGNFTGLLTIQGIIRGLVNINRHSLLKLEALLETVMDAVCMIDKNDRVVSWNEGSRALYNISSEEILGRPVDHYFSNLMITRAIKQKLKVRSTYHQPVKGTHVLINITPFKDGEEVIGAVSIERNISDIVQLNQQLDNQSNKVKILEENLSKVVSSGGPFSDIKGHHPKIASILSMALRVAPTDVPVLIRGEDGSGREQLARAIHNASDRCNFPFRVYNIDSSADEGPGELFGVQGSRGRVQEGLLAASAGGTIFLKGINNAGKKLQKELHYLIKDSRYFPVGSHIPRSSKVRLIMSGGPGSENDVLRDILWEDPHIRANVINLELPPLRERKEDIPELVYYFLNGFCRELNKKILTVDPGVMSLLMAYNWPGNVRELKGVVQSMTALAHGENLNVEYLPLSLHNGDAVQCTPGKSLNKASQRAERDLIMEVLGETGGNKTLAALKLGVPRSTLYYKMKNLKLI